MNEEQKSMEELLDEATGHLNDARRHLNQLLDDPELGKLFELPDWLATIEIDGEQ